MEGIQNKECVRKITMYPTAYTKCKIGKDWFLNRFEVVFVPDKCYPDYMQVNEYIMKEIEGKELNIEEAAYLLYRHLLDEYSPKEVTVEDRIRDCKTHFDVDVIIGK